MCRQYTEEECRKMLIRHLQALRDWWLNESRAPTAEEKIDGVIGSFLAMIDGESGLMPSFVLAPNPHPDDADFSKKNGEKWWPNDIVNLSDGELHSLWVNRKSYLE
jgi:hypothetical protein